MKKYLSIIALTTIALVGCSKVTPDNTVSNTLAEADQEISFQVVNYAGQTKANVEYENGPFGTYAWYNGSQTFMSNQKISYQTNAWKADGQTYYWPKTGSVDFISYSPYNVSPWLTVDKTTLSATVSSVASNADYLYSDKAIEQTQNLSTYTSISGNQGVPTLFHHALCQVCVKLKAEKLFNKSTEALSDVIWEIKLLDAGTYGDDDVEIVAPKIYNYATAGSLSMNLATEAADAEGARTNTWVLPTNSVWTTSAYTSSLACDAQFTESDPAPYTLTTTAVDILPLTTVVPQALGTQKLKLGFSIKTTNVVANTTITEYFPVELDMKTGMGTGAPQYWQMNKSITYTVIINPEGNEILFDPAVEDWSYTTQSYTHNINQ